MTRQLNRLLLALEREHVSIGLINRLTNLDDFAGDPVTRHFTFPPPARKSAAVPGTTFRSQNSVGDLAVSVFQGPVGNRRVRPRLAAGEFRNPLTI